MQPAPNLIAEPKLRTRLRVWLVIAAVLILSALAIWITGGFGRLPGYMGRPAAPGQTIKTEFWDFTINDVHVTTNNGRPVGIVVEARIMSKLTRSTSLGITSDTIAVYLPDQDVLLWSSVCSHNDDLSFDPYIGVDAKCRFDPEFDGVVIGGGAPTNVQLVIFDQELPQYDFQRTREPVAVPPPVYYVPFEADWQAKP